MALAPLRTQTLSPQQSSTIGRGRDSEKHRVSQPGMLSEGGHSQKESSHRTLSWHTWPSRCSPMSPSGVEQGMEPKLIQGFFIPSLPIDYFPAQAWGSVYRGGTQIRGCWLPCPGVSIHTPSPLIGSQGSHYRSIGTWLAVDA